MIDAIAELVTGNRIAPKVAFADASGISHFNNGAANGELRLCVGYELLEIPQANVYAMFEDART